MSQSKAPVSPFLEVKDALAVAAVINRLAASFDVKKELSVPEARVLLVLLVRTMSALVDAFPHELRELISYANTTADDEPDPTDSN